MFGSKKDYQPFSNELPEVICAQRPSSQDGAVELDSTSSIDSSTERPTVISGDTMSPRMNRLQLADSRLSNRSMSPATPSPPGSGNNSPNNNATRKRRSPPQSAISRDSIRSQTPKEDLNPDTDCSSLHVSPLNSPLKVTVSQTPPVAASNKRELSTKCPQKGYHEYETDMEIICSLHPSSVIQNNEVHLLFPDSKNEKDTVKICGLVDCQTTSAAINRKGVVCHAAGKVFYFKKLSLLSGQFNDGSQTWKLRLYQTVTKAQVQTWEQNSRFKFSVLRLDLKNSIPVSRKDDGIVLLSIINPETRQANSYALIYLFPPSKVSEKDWKGASLQLPQPRIRTAKYEIQSCIMMSNYVYFSLLLPEVGAYIYRVELTSLQHPKEMRDIINLKPEQITSWKIEDSTMQNRFLAVLKEDIIILSFIITNGKSVMEVKRLISPSSTEYMYPFPRVMKIIVASIVPGDQNPLIVVVYHDNMHNKCCIKRFKI